MTLRITSNDRFAVPQSSLQYQATEGEQSEIFRYDYLRAQKDEHPRPHLNIHARLDRDVLGDPGLAISPSIALFSVLVLTLGSLPATIWLYRKWRRSARQQSHAYDALAMTVIHVVDVIHGERHRWHHGKHVRRWCELLENFAVEVTIYLSLKDRVDPADTGLRRQLREEAMRVAEAIRSHKRVLVTASCIEDVERVTNSLVCGIDALVREDQAALLANAPDLPSRVNRLRAMIARILPGAVVIGIAVVLPLVPGIPPAAENSARWMLALVRISMILSSSPEAVGTVRDVLGKALPFK